MKVLNDARIQKLFKRIEYFPSSIYGVDYTTDMASLCFLKTRLEASKDVALSKFKSLTTVTAVIDVSRIQDFVDAPVLPDGYDPIVNWVNGKSNSNKALLNYPNIKGLTSNNELQKDNKEGIQPNAKHSTKRGSSKTEGDSDRSSVKPSSKKRRTTIPSDEEHEFEDVIEKPPQKKTLEATS
jgi:hypothetical protein